MPSLRVQDRALLTATELALMESSQPSRIRAYTSAQLNNRIVRVGRFWDKYRKLARQQQRTTKTSRQGSRLQTARTCEPSARGKVFAGALDRFEKQLEQLTREERRLPRPQVKPVPKSPRRLVTQRKRFAGRSSKVGRRMKQHGRHASRGSFRNRRCARFRGISAPVESAARPSVIPVVEGKKFMLERRPRCRQDG